MFPYWFVLGYFSVGALVGRARGDVRENYSAPGIIFGLLVIVLMIGFRWHVGSDWGAYYMMYQLAGHVSFSGLTNLGDPGYMLLNGVAQSLGADIWLVNLFCGAVFTWGLYQLARIQPDPWLALLIAVPYLVIVVAIGYSRQAVAIGIIMAGLARLSRGAGVIKFTAYVVLAAMFHRTAIMVLGLPLIGASRKSMLRGAAVLLGAVFFFYVMLGHEVDRFFKAYIGTQWSSSGALIRAVIATIPAIIFFAFRKRLAFNSDEITIWRNFALAALLVPVMLLVSPSSTAVDRMALYLLPLQPVVLSRLPLVLRAPGPTRLLMVLYCAAILFVWLNFGENSADWMPYQARMGGMRLNAGL